jgi:hypothetical protein
VRSRQEEHVSAKQRTYERSNLQKTKILYKYKHTFLYKIESRSIGRRRNKCFCEPLEGTKARRTVLVKGPLKDHFLQQHLIFKGPAARVLFLATAHFSNFTTSRFKLRHMRSINHARLLLYSDVNSTYLSADCVISSYILTQEVPIALSPFGRFKTRSKASHLLCSWVAPRRKAARQVFKKLLLAC